MKKPKQPNQSIISAVECLYTVTSLGKAVGADEIAQLLSKEYTHTHRVLKTLSHMGILGKTPDNKYIPGYGLYMLSAQALRHSKLLEKSIEILQAQVRKNLILAVGILFRDKVWYLIHTKPGGKSLQPQDMSIYDAKNSVIATCLSAFMHDEVLIDYYKTTSMRRTQEQIRAGGYHFEAKEDGNAIAFPIAPLDIKEDINTCSWNEVRGYFKNINPIAGIAFADKSKSLREEQMHARYFSVALSLCRQLYH